MDQNERRIIDDLFAKLREAERRSGPRDAGAEALIRRHVADQPAAPYYMAQAIVVQEQALAASQARVEELERQLAEGPAGGGFLSGLFGGGRAETPALAPGRPPRPPQPAGGGFLAGAMQTAMGVAGGVLIANALTGAFTPAEAAAEPAPEDLGDTGEFEDTGDFGDFGGDGF